MAEIKKLSIGGQEYDIHAASAATAAAAADAASLGGVAAANVTGSANSGAKASAYIQANESKWTSGEANQNAYASIKIYSAVGVTTPQTTIASAESDVFGFSASNNISLTATSDANGNPIIAISAKDTNTTYTTANFIAASSATNITNAYTYATDWNTNKTSVTNNASSGYAASSWISTNTETGSAKYAKSATSATNALNATNATSATKAASAGKLSAARNIASNGDVTWSVSFDGTAGVTGTATVANVPSAISWSGVSGAVGDAIDSKVAGVYRVKGTLSVADINKLTDKKIGDVYNVSDAGTLTDGNVAVLAGDNVVYTSASTSNHGWDKLASTLDTSNFALKNGNYSTSNGISAYSAVNAANAANATNLGGVAASNYSQTSHSHTFSSYTALADKPTIPAAANNGTLTIQKNGTAITSFGANNSSNVTANITVPTSLSDITSAHNHDYNVTVTDTITASVSAGVKLSAGSNVQITSAGVNTIGISAKDTTYSEATTSTLGLAKKSYVSNGVAYIF